MPWWDPYGPQTQRLKHFCAVRPVRYRIPVLLLKLRKSLSSSLSPRGESSGKTRWLLFMIFGAKLLDYEDQDGPLNLQSLFYILFYLSANDLLLVTAC